MTNTTTTDIDQLTTTVDTYLATWNESDAGRRAELVAQAWAAEGMYADPLLEVQGHVALADMAAGVQAQFPGHQFRRTTDIDTHHEFIRFGWELVAVDGSVVIAGIDVGVVGDDGLLRRIVGFFGDLTPTV